MGGKVRKAKSRVRAAPIPADVPGTNVGTIIWVGVAAAAIVVFALFSAYMNS